MSIKGKAEMLDMEETGNYVNNFPRIKFLLKITLPDKPPYQIKHEETVSYLHLRSIYTCPKVTVYVDPKDPENILLG